MIWEILRSAQETPSLYSGPRLWHVFAVRFAIFLSATLLACAFAHSQEQEKKLTDRLTRPDVSMANPAQNKTFYGDKSFQSGNASASLRDFNFVQKFSPKSFLTKEFSTKNHWAGDFKFSTKDANTDGRFTIPNATKSVETKTSEVKDARESGKDYSVRAFATNQFEARGKSQKTLDTEYTNKGPKSMDDVRELLNKNK